MVRKIVLLVVLIFSILVGCDNGLTPPDYEPISVDFPVTPLGGNPMGFWEPDTTNPVDTIILEELPVDSLNLDIEVEGIFSFKSDYQCSVLAEMDINLTVYLPIEPYVVPIPTIYDTLRCQGDYDVINGHVLALPMESIHFDLDTLGITADGNMLDLITPPMDFDYMGVMTVRLSFVFHLVRSSEIITKAVCSPAVIVRKQGGTK